MPKPSLALLDTTRSQMQLSSLFLRSLGWNIQNNVTVPSKFIMILAPHTSNWDLIFMKALMDSLGRDFYWFGKKELFNWPMGVVFRRLGGISIDRSLQKNSVNRTVKMIQSQDRIIIGITPEGTRAKASGWKSGFYHIAYIARVPIVLAFLDYSLKVCGLGCVVEPSGDITVDMKLIRKFYSGITPKHPENIGDIFVREELNLKSQSDLLSR